MQAERMLARQGPTAAAFTNGGLDLDHLQHAASFTIHGRNRQDTTVHTRICAFAPTTPAILLHCARGKTHPTMSANTLVHKSAHKLNASLLHPD
jgi:hypothetical protein